MYRVSKTMEIACAHNLILSYDSKCKNLHGHNFIVTVHCQSKDLNRDGMVIDFTHIKKMVHDKFDHGYLNDLVDFNPTAERLCKWIADNVPNCYKVQIQESSGNVAEWEED